ncbi:hypothetical protein GCM10027423_06630 [Spirosoma arcticum]
MHDETIRYSGQPVALVVAETFEMIRYAASLVRVAYEEEPHKTDLEARLSEARDPDIMNPLKPLPPKPRGDARKA